jgi:hypothetical protein
LDPGLQQTIVNANLDEAAEKSPASNIIKAVARRAGARLLARFNANLASGGVMLRAMNLIP